jgi:NAD(P)-dependent dehydrogenase (short-subunit alcohol dehydrogenase family)
MIEPRAYEAASRFDLTGRSVLITGAAHGLGLAMASAFVGAGARVALLDRDEEALAAVAAELSERADVCAHAVDVRKSVDVDAAVASAAKDLDGLDVVVNAAAIYPIEAPTKMDIDVFLDVLDVNVAGYARVTRAARRYLVASCGGRIINFSSITFMMGSDISGMVAYVSSKGAVVGFTRSLARELGPLGVTANAIAPGAFPTRTEDLLEDQTAYSEEVIRKQCIKRRGEVHDIAAAALFLASDAAVSSPAKPLW